MKIKKVCYSLFVSLLSIVLINSVIMSHLNDNLFINIIKAEVEEETDPPVEDNYSIKVEITYQGSPAEGVDITLSGNGENKSLTSSLNGNNIFENLTSGTYMITITFSQGSDYELAQGVNGSKSVTVSETNQSETVSFALKQKEPEKDENYEKIKAVKMPEQLTKIGSTTTKISEIPKDKLSSVSNFTFDNPGVNKIVLLENLDLSNYEDYSNISMLGDYIDLETKAKVKFDTDLLPIFNKKAKIYMFGIRIVDNIALENGENSKILIAKNGNIIENLQYEYSPSDQELSFQVDGFSTYTVVPQVQIDFSGLEKYVEEDNREDKEDEESIDQADVEEKEDQDSLNNNESLNDKYVYFQDTYALKVYVDNLDSKVTVFNGTELVNFPETPEKDGSLKGEIKLAEGDNRIRVNVSLENGEKIDEFFTINYDEKKNADNNASNVFGVIFFLIILVLGIGLGVYYIKLRRKQDMENNPSKSDDKKKKNFNYDPNLLTDEEKKMYGGEEDLKVDDNKNLIKKDKTVQSEKKVDIAKDASLQKDLKTNNNKSGE